MRSILAIPSTDGLGGLVEERGIGNGAQHGFCVGFSRKHGGFLSWWCCALLLALCGEAAPHIMERDLYVIDRNSLAQLERHQSRFRDIEDEASSRVGLCHVVDVGHQNKKFRPKENLVLHIFAGIQYPFLRNRYLEILREDFSGEKNAANRIHETTLRRSGLYIAECPILAWLLNSKALHQRSERLQPKNGMLNAGGGKTHFLIQGHAHRWCVANVSDREPKPEDRIASLVEGEGLHDPYFDGEPRTNGEQRRLGAFLGGQGGNSSGLASINGNSSRVEPQPGSDKHQQDGENGEKSLGVAVPVQPVPEAYPHPEKEEDDRAAIVVGLIVIPSMIGAIAMLISSIRLSVKKD